MVLYPLTVLLEVDDLDRRIELEATQTAGDAVLAFLAANPALYGAADRLYPGAANIRINTKDWRVTYGWRRRETFLQEVQVAAQQPAQVVTAFVQSLGTVDLAVLVADEAFDGGRHVRDRLLKVLLLQRGVFCPEGGFFSVPDQAARIAAPTDDAIEAQPERYALVVLGLAFTTTLSDERN